MKKKSENNYSMSNTLYSLRLSPYYRIDYGECLCAGFDLFSIDSTLAQACAEYLLLLTWAFCDTTVVLSVGAYLALIHARP